MQIFNGTPVPVKARADGMLYLINPGAILDVEQSHRGRTILDNYPALREVKHGDDLDELAEESFAAWAAHILEEVRQQNQHQLEQAKQGLKPSATNYQLKRFAKLVEERTGKPLDLLEDDSLGGDPVLGAIRSLGMAVKRMKEDTPEKQQMIALLDELIQVKGSKDKHVEQARAEILDTREPISTVPAAVRARRSGRIVEARQAKGKK